MRSEGIAQGEIVAGKYRIEKVLGHGGMGIVFSSHHLALGVPIAIKVLRKDVISEPDAVNRFLREARTLARLGSEHIVRVFDVGTLPAGQPFMAMELLEGGDLAGMLVERKLLPLGEAVSYVLEAITGLAEAHALGVVHRDLKPSNLFLARRGDGSTLIKVLDFGVSKVMRGPIATELPSFPQARLLGTPQYMSPEQLRALPDVDARADIWALGVVLYRLLSGRLPFRSDTLPELCANIIAGQHESLSAHLPELPPRLCAVIDRCLAKARDGRYTSVQALAADLHPFSSPKAHVVSSASYASVSRSEQVVRSAETPTETQPLAPAKRSPSATNRVPRALRSRLPIALSAALLFGALGTQKREHTPREVATTSKEARTRAAGALPAIAATSTSLAAGVAPTERATLSLERVNVTVERSSPPGEAVTTFPKAPTTNPRVRSRPRTSKVDAPPPEPPEAATPIETSSAQPSPVPPPSLLMGRRL